MKTMTRMGVLGMVAVGLCVSDVVAVSYVLTNAPGTTVTFEAKQVDGAGQVTAANSIVRSLGTPSSPTLGILSDATLTTLVGSGVAFYALNDNGGDGKYDYIAQGGGVIKSALDLTFVAPSGQAFTTGNFRVNTTVLNGGTALWDVGIDYLAWQVSTNGGVSFTDIHKRIFDGVTASRMDSGDLTIPGISGFSSIIIRGLIDASIGSLNSTSTGDHWHLISTSPFTDAGQFAGGLKLNLTTSLLPEPASLSLLVMGGLLVLRRRRRN